MVDKPVRLIRLVTLGAVCLLASLVLVASQSTAAAQRSDVGRPDTVTLTPSDSPFATGDNIPIEQVGNAYLSPILEAARPFTDVLLRWEGELPGVEVTVPPDVIIQPGYVAHNHQLGELMVVEIRTSPDGTTWSEWTPTGDNHDMWEREDGPNTFWSHFIYAGENQRYYQVRATANSDEEGNRPVLVTIDVHTLDANFDPADAPPPPEPEESASGDLQAIGKPPVVSRTGWGNPQGQGTGVAPAYRGVTHMVVHHTVTPNAESNYAARVRAIWSYHTYTQGWGDVGYNFLVDPNGVIYEGRAGGDNAVGFHDTGNYGSMGVALLGSFDGVNPTSAAQSSLVELLAWKANQRGINPLTSSYYYGCDISSFCYAPGAVVPNISGHRNITGASYTSCPGQNTFDLLPSIRNRVQDRLNGGGGGSSGGGGNTPFTQQPDNGDLIIDQSETGTFAYSDANWYPASCGYGGETRYTFATDNASDASNSATWRPNIPEDGDYRVLVSIPQNCGLDSTPTALAKYRVMFDGGTEQVTIDQRTTSQWADLGVYRFKQGNSGAVELYDYPAEPFSQQRVMYFDAIQWVKEEPQAEVALLDVRYDSNEVAVGELLQVTFRVQNTGAVPLETQAPESSKDDSGSYLTDEGYVYDEGECFRGNGTNDYPVFDKEAGRFRVMLGATNRFAASCDGDTGGYPWRWGLNGTLQPGETRDITGYVRFREPGTITLQAGIVEEYAQYRTEGVGTRTITVTAERETPVAAQHDRTMQAQAFVYELGQIPDNFLGRTSNALSIPLGDYLGSFAWDGTLTNWEDGGPLEGLADRFVIVQTRPFYAPVSGEYTFRTISDDGSWLWVNGQQVVNNYGLHQSEPMTGTIELDAGVHVLSFRYFESTGTAEAGYAMRLPGSDDDSYVVPDDPMQGGVRFGDTYIIPPTDMVLVADDQAGSGIDYIRYAINFGSTRQSDGNMVRLDELGDGVYTVTYRAVDNAGNESDEQTLTFTIDSTLEVERTFIPHIIR